MNSLLSLLQELFGLFSVETTKEQGEAINDNYQFISFKHTLKLLQ